MLGKPWVCADTDAHLDELLMGELSPFKRRAFGAHRHQCDRCNAAITEGVKTVGALRAWTMESPSPALVERVLAARPALQPAPRVSLIRLTQVTVVWAVCLMVALVGVVLLVNPDLLHHPGSHSIAWLGSAVQALRTGVIVGSAALGGIPALAWIGLGIGVAAFYAAALAGLRVFLIRRST